MHKVIVIDYANSQLLRTDVAHMWFNEATPQGDPYKNSYLKTRYENICGRSNIIIALGRALALIRQLPFWSPGRNELNLTGNAAARESDLVSWFLKQIIKLTHDEISVAKDPFSNSLLLRLWQASTDQSFAPLLNSFRPDYIYLWDRKLRDKLIPILEGLTHKSYTQYYTSQSHHRFWLTVPAEFSESYSMLLMAVVRSKQIYVLDGELWCNWSGSGLSESPREVASLIFGCPLQEIQIERMPSKWLQVSQAGLMSPDGQTLQWRK